MSYVIEFICHVQSNLITKVIVIMLQESFMVHLCLGTDFVHVFSES